MRRRFPPPSPALAIKQVCRYPISAAIDTATSAPLPCRPFLSLVSRRWLRLCFSVPSWWRTVRLHLSSWGDLRAVSECRYTTNPYCEARAQRALMDWLGSKGAVLERAAPLIVTADVRSAHWEGPGSVPAGAVMAHEVLPALLQPTLQGLHIRHPGLPSEALECLPAFTRLTQLAIESCTLPDAALASLSQLSRLQRLSWAADDDLVSLAQAAAGVAQLSSLTALQLYFKQPEDQPYAPHVQQLVVLLQSLSQLAALQSFSCFAGVLSHEALAAVARLHQLTRLHLAAFQVAALHPLTTLAQLHQLHVQQARLTPDEEGEVAGLDMPAFTSWPLLKHATLASEASIQASWVHHLELVFAHEPDCLNERGRHLLS